MGSLRGSIGEANFWYFLTASGVSMKRKYANFPHKTRGAVFPGSYRLQLRDFLYKYHHSLESDLDSWPLSTHLGIGSRAREPAACGREVGAVTAVGIQMDRGH
jgi:hypothetical protein